MVYFNLRICRTCCFVQTGYSSSNESRLEYRQKMVWMLKSDNFEFQSGDVSSNKKLSLWKRDSPHEFELALFADSQSAHFRSFIVATELAAILHFELKYASCRNDSYYLAVTEATVFRRKVNFSRSYQATESSSTETKYQKIKRSSATFYRRRMGDGT